MHALTKLRPFASRFALASLAAAGLVDCSASGGEDTCYAGEYSEGSRATHPIVGGAKAVAYTESAIVDGFDSGKAAASCSGVVIAPRVVLTSGRCVAGHDGWRVITPFAKAQTRVTKSAATPYQPGGPELDPEQHDLGVIFVDEPFMLDSYPRLAKDILASGATIVNVGRMKEGKVSDHDLTAGKPVAVEEGSLAGYPLHYLAGQGAEPGDVGGPAFLPGKPPHTVIGVLSSVVWDKHLVARADLQLAWLTEQIATHGGPGANEDPGDPGATGGTGGEAGAGPEGGSGAGAGGQAGTGGEPEYGGAAGTGPQPGGGGGGPDPGGWGGDPGWAGASGDDSTQVCNGNPEFEPNDSEQPQALFPLMCGKLDTAGDEDWYVFGVTGAGVSYRVEVVGGDAQVVAWKLVQGQFYSIPNQSPEVVENTSNDAGTYYVGVWSPTGTPCEYALTLVVDNQNSSGAWP